MSLYDNTEWNNLNRSNDPKGVAKQWIKMKEKS